MHDAIREPIQARSRKTMDEVYRSMDALLRDRSFDKITIADLAAHANVSVGSIYARFKDKNALLAGLYLIASGEAKKCLPPLAAPIRWEDVADEKMVRSALIAIDRFYSRNSHIFAASVFASVPHIERGRLDVWQVALDEFSALLVARYPEASADDLRLGVRIIIRFTTAIMHQAMLTDSVNRWRGRVPNRILIDELTRFSLDVIARARTGALDN